jgi:hypothetical protein
MVMVLAPEVLHCKVTRVPGAGEGFGVAVNDNTFGGGTTVTLIVAEAVTDPTRLVAVSVYTVVAGGDTS